MSETLDHLNEHGSIRYCWVLAIEGYENVITNHADTSAVGTAWGATPWDRQVIAGLRVEGDFEQGIEPWQRSLAPSSFRFFVMDADGADTFGQLMGATAGGNETELADAQDCDSTAWAVKDTSDFASEGVIYCGVEAIAYSGKSGTSFTGLTRGIYSPFRVDGSSDHEFGRDHTFEDADFGVQIQSKVTDAPRHWTGKYVGLWMHRVVGDVVCTKAEAHLVFAGIVRDVQDVESGEVMLDCQDIRAKAKNTTLMHDQFVGRVGEGLYLSANMTFRAREVDIGTGGSSIEIRDSNPLTVVASGASGADEINAGVYTVEEIASRVSDWLAAETVATRLNGAWAFGLRPTDSGLRMVLGVANVDTGSWRAHLYLPPQVAGFCGYGTDGQEPFAGSGYKRVNVHGVGAGEETQTANDPPMRVAITSQPGWTGRVVFTGTQGTWINQAATLPQRFQNFLDGTSQYGILKTGDTFVLAKRVDAVTYDLQWNEEISLLLGGSAREIDGLTLDDDGELEFSQVFMWEGTFQDFLLRVLSSTGTSGYNHATYDEFPAQMGAAIPWELLGDGLEDSLESLEAETAAQIMVVIEKPTALETEILSDLLLRVAWLIFHQGTFRIAQFQNPLAAISVHNFTEVNKGSAVPRDPQRVVGAVTSEHLINVVKLAYNRAAFGSEDYRVTKTVKYAASISDYGESKAFTINARHSYESGPGGNVDALAANVIGKLVPIWGRPVKILQGRTLQPEFFESVAPGDLCTVTDNFARDPVTGARGLSGKPGLVLRKRYGWGGDGADMYGEADILIVDGDNTAIYSPSAGLVATSYSTSGGPNILLTSDYSGSSDEDGAHFTDGDAVSIVEIDPDDPATAERWDTSIDFIIESMGVYQVYFDDALTGFDDSGDTKYRMVSQSYSNATATQKTDAYQADDADLKIEDLRTAYAYGRYVSTVGTENPSTELPERHSVDMYGDGVPLSTHTHRAAARWLNNFIDYKGAIQAPQMFRSEIAPHVTGTDWQLMYLMPVFFGPGQMGSVSREIAASVLGRVTASTGKLRVTVSLNPPVGSNDVNVQFFGPYQQKEFSFNAGVTTDYTIPAAKDLPQVGWFRRGVAYLSIEAQSSNTRILGIGEWQQQAR